MNEKQRRGVLCEAGTGGVVYEERVPRARNIYASTLLADGRLHSVSRRRPDFCVAAKPSFELLAANDLRDGSLFHATPVAMDGKLFIRSDKFLYCLRRSEW